MRHESIATSVVLNVKTKIMKRVLVIIILFSFRIVLGNDTIENKLDTLKTITPQIECDSVDNQNSSSLDTIYIPFNSDSIVIPTIEDNLTRIVMIKEKSRFDSFKYLLPIITLLLGILIKELIDRWSNSKKIKESGKRWVAEIQALEEPIRDQIDSLKSFENEHTENSFKIPEIVVYSSLNCEVFKSLDKDNLVQYIRFCNKKLEFREVIKISNKTHGFISVLNYLHETLKTKFQDFLNGTSKHIDSFTQNLQSLMMAFANYGLSLEKEIGKDPKDDARYRPILDLFSKYILPKMKTGEYNPFELGELFFTPLLQTLSQLRLDDRTRTLSMIVSNCFNDIKGIQMENKYIAENISNIKKQYETQLNDLKNVISDIEKKH